MKTVVFETPEQRELGLQHLPSIPDDTVFVFAFTRPGALFHSRNCPEPFEVVFMSASEKVLRRGILTPPNDTIIAPPGTTHTYEARPGVLHGL
jgi:uncharacterized membrane protein (UPF0127 family)